MRRKETSVRPAICRFNGCDSEGSVTVGIMPLCPLHQSYIFQLMDRGASSAEVNADALGDGWLLIPAGGLDG